MISWLQIIASSHLCDYHTTHSLWKHTCYNHIFLIITPLLQAQIYYNHRQFNHTDTLLALLFLWGPSTDLEGAVPAPNPNLNLGIKKTMIWLLFVWNKQTTNKQTSKHTNYPIVSTFQNCRLLLIKLYINLHYNHTLSIKHTYYNNIAETEISII